MGRNNLIVFVGIFLIFILGATFIICSIKINELRSVRRNTSVYTEYPTYIPEEESVTKELPISKYLTFTVYRDDRSEVNLSEYEDVPVMILFFNDQDEESIKVLDLVESIYKEYEDKVKFLMINTNLNVNYELVENYTLEVFYDFYKEATRKYNITEYPSMIYISETNEIINARSGVPTLDALEANLQLLSGDY